MRDAAHRRQHCCANINDLACSGFNLHLAAVGMMAVRAVVYCCAVLCCAVLCCPATAVGVACVCFHRGHQKRCFITRKCSRILRTKNKRCTWSKKVPTCQFWETIYISRWLSGLKESPIVFTSKTRWVISSFQIKKY